MEIYIVKKGDTLWQIADQFGVSLRRLIADNGIENPDKIVPGQALLILLPKTTRTVRVGDSIASIAKGAGITTNELLQNNPELIFQNRIFVGQQLVTAFDTPKLRRLSTNAYAYTDINREVLLRSLPYLTYLTIFGYGITPEGNLLPTDDDALIRLAYNYNTAPIMLLSSVTEDGTFSGERASMLFNDRAMQDKLLEEILQTMCRKRYVGLDIDFEFVEQKDAAGFLAFIENATRTLGAAGYFVNVDLAPKVSADQKGLLYEAHNYAAIGAIADRVLLMTYEWGYTYGPPMAVAPLNQVRRVAEYAVTDIPPHKIYLGIPNYGYDWQLPFEQGVSKALSIGNQHAVGMAARYQTEILFDELAQSPYFFYTSNDLAHVVWFEDVRSILAKLELVDELRFPGVGYWNAMRPFNQNWSLLAARYHINKLFC